MFYKIENNNWLIGTTIYLPNGDVLTDTNSNNNYGWEWYNEPPQEYLHWKEENENRLEINGSEY